MVEGSPLGASTITGTKFEEKVKLSTYLPNNGYKIDGNLILKDEKVVAELYRQSTFESFLGKLSINQKKVLSSRLIPDDVLYVYKNRTLYILEYKFQKVSGSTDEKLQTCDFKLRQYKKLFKDTDITVKYVYVLNDWFKHPKYKDNLEYIEEVGCHYFFYKVPLTFFDI